jgi:hypothetical protein
MAFSLREGVELFHIALLGELGTRLDKGRYAVKGGCNLRFFFKSPRYSEDLDVDVGNVPVATLKGNVKRVLEGKALRFTLAASQVEVTSISSPKQTETTQRWKLALRIGGLIAHTKLEFSRRALDAGRLLDAIDPALVARYGLSPVLVSHYSRAAALRQKCQALLGRSETQARDIFDLDLLLAGASLDEQVRVETGDLAAEKALSIDYGKFKSQVVAYLPAPQQALYDDPTLWEQLQQRVVGALMGAGK